MLVSYARINKSITLALMREAVVNQGLTTENGLGFLLDGGCFTPRREIWGKILMLALGGEPLPSRAWVAANYRMYIENVLPGRVRLPNSSRLHPFGRGEVIHLEIPYQSQPHPFRLPNSLFIHLTLVGKMRHVGSPQRTTVPQANGDMQRYAQ
jgi:hypothetical protein